METAKPKTIEDFPKLVVTAEPRRVTAENGSVYFEVEGRYDPELEGPFDEMINGDSPDWFWLLNGERGCLFAVLKSFDKETRTAIFESGEKEGQPGVGWELAYLDSHWQAYHVWMVLDRGWGWERKQFLAADVVAEDYEAENVSIIDGREVRVWTKVVPTGPGGGQSRHYPAEDQTLPVRTGTRLVPAMWDHQHCELCNEHIDAGMWGYCDPRENWMCEKCYERYVVRRDLAYVDEL
jgi:hypothetical protein